MIEASSYLKKAKQALAKLKIDVQRKVIKLSEPIPILSSRIMLLSGIFYSRKGKK